MKTFLSFKDSPRSPLGHSPNTKCELKRDSVPSPPHRLALDGLAEELAGGDEHRADDEHGDRPFVVQLERQVVDRDLADAKEYLSRGLGEARGLNTLRTWQNSKFELEYPKDPYVWMLGCHLS